jgi:predicted  nucleic acid-binding Zn-ribbon protein
VYKRQGHGDAAVIGQATSRTASIRRRTASALQALRRAHAAEQAAALAREALVAEEAKGLRLRKELQVATERATAVQQPTQSLVRQLMEARQEADHLRNAADAAAVELAALRGDFRRVLDARMGLDESLGKALAKMVTAGLSKPATRPGRRTMPLRR